MKLATEISLLLPKTAVTWAPGIPFGSGSAALALGNDSDAFLSRHSFSLGAAGSNPAVTEALCRVAWINAGTTVRTQQSMRKSHPIKIFTLLRDRQVRDQSGAAFHRLF